MPVKDIRSNMLPKLCFLAIINSDTTTNGSIIDTADFDPGMSYNFFCTVYGAGTYVPVLEESDASDMSGATNVAAANIIGTLAGATITAANAAGATGQNLYSFGIFGTKRYVRLKVTSTSSTTTTIVGTVQCATEISPSASLSA